MTGEKGLKGDTGAVLITFYMSTIIIVLKQDYQDHLVNLVLREAKEIRELKVQLYV